MSALHTCPTCGAVVLPTARRVTVRVGEHHIALGQGGDAMQDPMALALLEATGMHWVVAGSYAYSVTTGQRVSLPAAAQEFVHAIDKDEPLRPLTFDLDLPA